MSLFFLTYVRKSTHQIGERSIGDVHCVYVHTPQQTISTLVGVLTNQGVLTVFVGIPLGADKESSLYATAMIPFAIPICFDI